MIKINIEEDYIDVKINTIFNELAKSIVKKLKGVQIDFYDEEDTLVAINEVNIYNFLTSKNFSKYDYKIYGKRETISNEIVRDWLTLQCGGAISSVLKPRNNSNIQYKEFYNKYRSVSGEFFSYLEEFNEQLKVNPNKSHKISIENKREFLEKYYPSYYCMVDAFTYKLLKDVDRDIILSKMNVNVCPYCNMNYTLNYNKNNKIKASADLDHFYVKSLYPLYALCLYNFIPSCSICNSRLKVDSNMTIDTYIYPHENAFSDQGVFTITNLIEYLIGACDYMEIKLSNLSEDDRIKKSSELFQLEHRYQYFETLAEELLNKVGVYNDFYQKELNTLLQEFNHMDIRTLIFGKKLTEEEILNESLGKFRMDLLKDFGVY